MFTYRFWHINHNTVEPKSYEIQTLRTDQSELEVCNHSNMPTVQAKSFKKAQHRPTDTVSKCFTLSIERKPKKIMVSCQQGEYNVWNCQQYYTR